MNLSESLSAFLLASWGTPYQIGKWDCVLFIAAWVDWLTGTSHLDDLRDTYRSENGGRNLHAPLGLTKAIRTTLIPTGWQQVSAPYEVGDIILTDMAHPGIWDGDKILAQPAQGTGLLHLHESHARAGLRPPRELP